MSGLKVWISPGGQPTRMRPARVGAGVAASSESSRRMARAEVKCSCCTETCPSYHPWPISTSAFCSSSKHTVSGA
jgi:hypothetical protein